MENPSQVARVYKLNWKWRIFPVFLLVLGIVSTHGLMTGRFHPTRRFGMSSSIFLLLAGAVTTVHAFTVKIVLSDQPIQKRGLLENSRLLTSQIRGRSETIVAGRLGISDSWKLEPIDPKVRAMSVSNSFNLDHVFCAWLDRIPSIGDPDSPEEDAPDPNCNN